MVDRVFIEDLRIDAIIGVYAWERTVRQTLTFDLEMAWDTSQAAATDDVAFCLDYSQVVTRLQQEVESSSFALIETLGQRVLDILTEEFGIPWVKLRLGKPGAIGAARSVGLILERGEWRW